MYGFPKSSYLKEKRVVLGNTARNLASQALHRMSSFEKVLKMSNQKAIKS